MRVSAHTVKHRGAFQTRFPNGGSVYLDLETGEELAAGEAALGAGAALGVTAFLGAAALALAWV